MNLRLPDDKTFFSFFLHSLAEKFTLQIRIPTNPSRRRNSWICLDSWDRHEGSFTTPLFLHVLARPLLTWMGWYIHVAALSLAFNLPEGSMYMFLGNCPPTPAQTLHFAQGERQVLMLSLGRGRWAVSLKHTVHVHWSRQSTHFAWVALWFESRVFLAQEHNQMMLASAHISILESSHRPHGHCAFLQRMY